MSDLAQYLGLGFLIGIVLFFICERKGLLHKWSGLKDPREIAKANQNLDEKAS